MRNKYYAEEKFVHRRAGVNNWFPDYKSWLLSAISLKLHTLTHHELRMTPIDFGVKRSKVKVIGLWWLKMVSGSYQGVYCTYHHETCQKCFPWVKDDPYWFWGQKVKGQGHRSLMIENGFRIVLGFVLHLSSWNMPEMLSMIKVNGNLISRKTV